MQQLIHHYSQRPPLHDQNHTRLIEEIAYLEARLIAIGETGDCAYEKSLARSYTELLHSRRKQLNSLRN